MFFQIWYNRTDNSWQWRRFLGGRGVLCTLAENFQKITLHFGLILKLRDGKIRYLSLENYWIFFKSTLEIQTLEMTILYSTHSRTITFCDFLWFFANFRKNTSKNTTNPGNIPALFWLFFPTLFWHFFCNSPGVSTLS